ncbi:MAG: hypothetical protein Hyperionvirus38_11 [Hyperionvirus sp.]|uniref:Uncharacterized protein n=1 Tax=Hyperionvirus sp. TaxID=2487770 RepID=A0A3G5AFV1_9VIRU|nr:MAG: hypothetical protein Hyperionvirus38_11 [Hyperionvirus sp.]
MEPEKNHLDLKEIGVRDNKEHPPANYSSEYNELRRNITSKLVLPSYFNDVRDLLKWRYIWRRIGNSTLAFSKIFIAINAVLSFSSLAFGLDLLTFLAGCVSVLSLVLLHFSTFSFSRSKESTQEANQILTTLGIKQVPDIVTENINDDQPNVSH